MVRRLYFYLVMIISFLICSPCFEVQFLDALACPLIFSLGDATKFWSHEIIYIMLRCVVGLRSYYDSH